MNRKCWCAVIFSVSGNFRYTTPGQCASDDDWKKLLFPKNNKGYLTMKDIKQRYANFASYLRTLPIKPYQIAHLLHLMQNVNFDIIPDGYATPPHTINFAVNNQCNLRCQYCDLHHGRVNKELHNAKIDFGVIESKKKQPLYFGLS